MTDRASTTFRVEDSRRPLMEEEVVEIPLLLPGWEVSILETVAHQRGLTAGAMVRHLLHDFLAPKTPGSSQQAS